MLSNQSFTKKFLKRKQMLAEKVFVFFNDDYTDPESPYVTLIKKHLSPQITLNQETGHAYVECKDNQLNNMLLYCINEYTQRTGSNVSEFYQRFGDVLDQIVVYWMVELNLNKKECEQYADLFCEHFHKFTKQPLQHIDAQVKYKKILDNCLAMLDSQEE